MPPCRPSHLSARCPAFGRAEARDTKGMRASRKRLYCQPQKTPLRSGLFCGGGAPVAGVPLPLSGWKATNVGATPTLASRLTGCCGPLGVWASAARRGRRQRQRAASGLRDVAPLPRGTRAARGICRAGKPRLLHPGGPAALANKIASVETRFCSIRECECGGAPLAPMRAPPWVAVVPWVRGWWSRKERDGPPRCGAAVSRLWKVTC